MTDRIGQRLGNYRLLRLLGQGGFAEVYLAEHLHLKTQVAIKVLKGQITLQDQQDFLKEAQTIAALKHPHVLRVLEFGFEHTTPFLVMDYAPMGTLRERYPRGALVPLTTVVSYTKQVGSALQHAHTSRLIHRDVKPENMLMENSQIILLSDFGIATMAHSTSSQQTQNNIGTIHYMAPEQIQGKPCPASDQYALGITIYEWLCGTRPFTGTSLVEIAMHHISDAPPSLRERVSTISPQVEQVVLTSLAKDPRQRFTTVDAFIEALEYASANETPSRSRFWSSFFSQTQPAPTKTQKVPTNRSNQIGNKEASRSPDRSNQAYEFLRQSVAKDLARGMGAAIVRTTNERIGQAVHLLSESDWISLSASMPEIRETSGYTDHSLVKKKEVNGHIIATAIFELYIGDYILWMDINKPVSVSITRDVVLIVEIP